MNDIIWIHIGLTIPKRTEDKSVVCEVGLLHRRFRDRIDRSRR